MWGLDFNEAAARTWQANFSGICEVCPIWDFLQLPPADYKVDVMHFSPPCQPFSPNQTRPASDCEDKEAVITSLYGLLKMVRPRIVTMEQTFGLSFERNHNFFAFVVRALVDVRFSVRWKLINAMHYGCPQARKRLILIAAAYAIPCLLFICFKPTADQTSSFSPSNPLPPFPTPTHLQNPATIASWISNPPLTTADLNHNPTPDGKARIPYSMDGPARSLVDTGGGKNNYYPDGTRPFTLRELACLQTFPRDFKFCGMKTSIRRQIGNAVPCVLGKAIMEEVVRCLREWDTRHLNQ